MTELVLFAEFDIAKGSTLRAFYPNDPLNHSPEFFADLMLPEGVHNREHDHTVFFLNRKSDDNDPFLYCLSIVQTKYDTSARRGAIVKAVALCSKYHFYFCFKDLLEIAMAKLMNELEPSVVMQELYNTINAVDTSGVVNLTDMQRRFMRRTICSIPLGRNPSSKANSSSWDTVATWGNDSIPISIKLCTTLDQHDEGLVSSLLRTFGDKTMKIYNALLSQSRIILLGYNLPAGQVCNYVLATSALLCPPLCGLLYRQFPYANLNDLAFLSVPGYIAGVTNPMFKGKREWWDLLCDVSNGQILSNADRNESEECESSDREFVQGVLEGLQAGFTEDWVRAQFEDYTSRNIVDIAFSEAVFRDPDTQSRQIAINNKRITKWAATTSYKQLEEMRKDPTKFTPAFRVTQAKCDLRRYIRELTLGNITDSGIVEQIYSDFVSLLRTEDELQEFLSYLPDSRGGLHLVAQGLLHESMSVQRNTVMLLEKMEQFESTKSAVSDLNLFLMTAYNRASLLVRPKDC